MFRFDYDKAINMYKSKGRRQMRKAPSLENIELATDYNML